MGIGYFCEICDEFHDGDEFEYCKECGHAVCLTVWEGVCSKCGNDMTEEIK